MMMNLLAISGSLRTASYNTAAIQALISLAPHDIAIRQASISELPLFNPDLENEKIRSVELLKSLVGNADGLIIASPEYAHGISGPLKNALDWLVSGVEFPDTPIMLINTSPRASHAQAALKEVLTTMSGELINEAHVSISLLGSSLSADGILKDQDMADSLISSLSHFCEEIRQRSRLIFT